MKENSIEKIVEKKKYIYNIEMKEIHGYKPAQAWARNNYYATRKGANDYYIDEQDNVNWINHRKPYIKGVEYD